jgi:hypothetical protein
LLYDQGSRKFIEQAAYEAAPYRMGSRFAEELREAMNVGPFPLY